MDRADLNMALLRPRPNEDAGDAEQRGRTPSVPGLTTARAVGLPAARAVGPAAAAVSLFAVIVAVLFVVKDPRVAPSFLLVVPIAILTRASGAGAGLAAAVVALSAVVVSWEVESVEGGLGAVFTRAVVFFSIPPLMLWSPRSRTSDAPTLVDGSAGMLSNREVDVLRLLALGHTNAEVAEHLYLSVRTVESHRARIQRKIGRSGRPSLVSYAREKGLI
jgi:DNA-binding CsgD family transcriptional regulator